MAKRKKASPFVSLPDDSCPCDSGGTYKSCCRDRPQPTPTRTSDGSEQELLPQWVQMGLDREKLSDKELRTRAVIGVDHLYRDLPPEIRAEMDARVQGCERFSTSIDAGRLAVPPPPSDVRLILIPQVHAVDSAPGVGADVKSCQKEIFQILESLRRESAHLFLVLEGECADGFNLETLAASRHRLWQRSSPPGWRSSNVREELRRMKEILLTKELSDVDAGVSFVVQHEARGTGVSSEMFLVTKVIVQELRGGEARLDPLFFDLCEIENRLAIARMAQGILAGELGIVIMGSMHIDGLLVASRRAGWNPEERTPSSLRTERAEIARLRAQFGSGQSDRELEPTRSSSFSALLKTLRWFGKSGAPPGHS